MKEFFSGKEGEMLNSVNSFQAGHALDSRVEWFTTFLAIFEMDTLLPSRCIFMSSIPNNLLIFPRERKRSHFQKITGP